MDNNVPEDWTDRQEEAAIEKAIEMSLSEPSSIKLPPSLKSRTMVLDVMYRHSEYWSLIGIEDVSANFAPGMSCTRHLGQLPAKLRPEKKLFG